MSIKKPKFQQQFKIVVFGDGGVGKTTLINRYVSGAFQGNTIMTIGVGFFTKKLVVNDIEVSLQIWDFAGEDRFRFMLPSYVRGSSGGLFMFDITRFASLKNIKDWSDVVDICTDSNKRPLPVILVGGKLDLEYKRAVDKIYAEELLENKMYVQYIECSSKTGQNVELIFTRIAEEMLKRKGSFK